jgi:hypothetical protein
MIPKDLTTGVPMSFLIENNMYNHKGEYGIPKDINDSDSLVTWKRFSALTKTDFKILEEYVQLHKKNL